MSDLMQAAKAAAAWMHDPDANPSEEFERIGEEYQRATGRLRPGKSEPLESYRDSSSEENRERFRNWCEKRQREVLAGLRAAIALENQMVGRVVRVPQPRAGLLDQLEDLLAGVVTAIRSGVIVPVDAEHAPVLADYEQRATGVLQAVRVAKAGGPF